MFGKGAEKTNEQVNRSEETTLRLSDDIGKIAVRIGDMADRIGDMSERILETQKIQSKNLELMQESVMEAMKMMGKQMESTNEIMDFIVKKGMGVDMIGFNYRLPNINAALGCAQMEKIDWILNAKREIASKYQDYFKDKDIRFVKERDNTRSNYWLNTIVLKNKRARDEFLKTTNDNGVMTRPIWRLMNELEMYRNCQCGDLTNAKWLEERVVNIPSGVSA